MMNYWQYYIIYSQNWQICWVLKIYLELFWIVTESHNNKTIENKELWCDSWKAREHKLFPPASPRNSRPGMPTRFRMNFLVYQPTISQNNETPRFLFVYITLYIPRGIFIPTASVPLTLQSVFLLYTQLRVVRCVPFRLPTGNGHNQGVPYNFSGHITRDCSKKCSAFTTLRRKSLTRIWQGTRRQCGTRKEVLSHSRLSYKSQMHQRQRTLIWLYHIVTGARGPRSVLTRGLITLWE
jgi:hypothetical protein